MSDVNAGSDFFSILKEKDPNLASCFENVRKKGLDDWVYLLTPDMGSHSGYPHLRNVERIANKIVPDHLKAGFSAGEIFLLLSAIFLHDIGKTKPIPDAPLGICEHPDKCQFLKDGRPLCLGPKYSHFILGEELIKTHGIALGLPDEKIAQYCGLIVFCHGLQIPPTEDQRVISGDIKIDDHLVEGNKCEGKWGLRGDYRTTSLALYGSIRIPLLAEILRIADETDDSWTRAYQADWAFDQKSKSKNFGKAFRRCIEDIEFCHDGKCLVMHIPDMDDMEIDDILKEQYIQSINNAKVEIKNVIAGNWGKELKKIGVEFNSVYLEYKNRIYKNLATNVVLSSHRPAKGSIPPYRLTNEIDAIGLNRSIEEMFNAMVELSLGSCEYHLFNWETLEAQVGHPLTSVDKWLAKRIADASENEIEINDQDEIRVDVAREKVKTIKDHLWLRKSSRRRKKTP